MRLTNQLLALGAPMAALLVYVSMPAAHPNTQGMDLELDEHLGSPVTAQLELPPPAPEARRERRNLKAARQVVRQRIAKPALTALSPEELPRFAPPIRSDTVGADLYVNNMVEVWSDWESSDQETQEAQQYLLASLQLSVAVVLNQFGRYQHERAPSHDTTGAPLRFILNGYSYYFHDGEFPEYDELLLAKQTWTPDSPTVPAHLHAAVFARLAEAKSYLEQS